MEVDEDGYETDEEILVHVEFDCEVDNKNFDPESTLKLIGIDAENPIMQLGSKMYRGEWRDVVGTSVFLEDDVEKNLEGNRDPLFSKKLDNYLKVAGCTRKSLVMSRVFIRPKTDEKQDNSSNGSNGKSVSEEKSENNIPIANMTLT